MTRMLTLLAALLLTDPHLTESTVPCASVADCWLDKEGHPVARPAKLKGRALPRGDCGAKILWLRTTLTCSAEKHVCVAEHIGDKC